MFKQLNVTEATKIIEDRDLIIADVRDIDSYNEEHINNAIHLSMPTLQDFCENADKEQPILVYCYHGITSQSVAQHLIDQGFSEVFSLVGGFEMWREHHTSK